MKIRLRSAPRAMKRLICKLAAHRRAPGLTDSLPEKRVMFAFASSAEHRERDHVTSVDLKKITIGQISGAPSNKALIGRIFDGTKCKVAYEPNMEDYLLCHAAFVLPAAFACCKTDGNLKKLKGNTEYLSRLIDANIEGYRAIRSAGHAILPKSDADFEGAAFLCVWDGIRNEFSFAQFFVRFLIVLYGMEIYDILFFDWVLLSIRTSFPISIRNSRASSARICSVITQNPISAIS